MAKIVAGSSITLTVLVTDNTSLFNNPNGTPQPVAVSSILITLYTRSGATPVSAQPMLPGTQIGYYTFTYNSATSDERGQWWASFRTTNAGMVGISPKQQVFELTGI